MPGHRLEGEGLQSWTAGLGLGAALAIGTGLATRGAGEGPPRRFALVEPGKIYRGGYPSEAELVWLRQLGVRGIVSLMEESRDAEKAGREHAAAVELGLRLDEYPMPGD